MNCLRLSLALLVLPSFAQAQVIISNIDDPDGSSTSFGSGTTTQFKAYGFTMGTDSFPLEEVVLRINPTGVNPTPLVELRDDAGGLPGIPLVTLDNPAAFTVEDDYSFRPSTPFTLSANTTYWIYMRSDPIDGDGFRWTSTSGGLAPMGPHATQERYVFNGATSSTTNKLAVIGGNGSSPIGINYCSAAPNSTGMAGSMLGLGSSVVAVDDFNVMATNLPPNQFGIFLVSRDQAFVPGASGTSNGNLCLGGSIGRFFNANQIVSSGASGEYSLQLPLQAFPQGNGFVSVVAGDTWNFQSWHRDSVGQASNFTDGYQVMFQ